jgi:hypothetical protein
MLGRTSRSWELGEERERELLAILKSSSWIIDSSVDLISVNFQYRK